jgi:hypothetical protein
MQTLFLETTGSNMEPIRRIRCVFNFSNQFFGQKLLDRECLTSWSIVMVENPTAEAKFRPFSTQFHVTTSIFHIISLVDCLALWNEFKVNNTFDIKESDHHCLHL